MELQAILEVLGFANSIGQGVRLVLTDGSEVVGVPTTVDLEPDANEVFLKPTGDDEAEIGVSIGAITSAQLT